MATARPEHRVYEASTELAHVKRLVQDLKKVRGSGLVSLAIPPGAEVSDVVKVLEDEKIKASCISSSSIRRSAVRSLTSVQERLELYRQCPPTGLVIYGVSGTGEDEEKLLIVDVEPFHPVNTLSFKCDSKLHTDVLDEMMESCGRVGLIVVAYSGFLFGTISAGRRNVLHKAWVGIRRYRRGTGTSAVRFVRIRQMLIRKCVLEVAETAAGLFIADGKLNISGIVLAGVPLFTNGLVSSDAFDERLAAKVVKVVDLPYGGERGFDEAVDLAAEEIIGVEVDEEEQVRVLRDKLEQILPTCWPSP